MSFKLKTLGFAGAVALASAVLPLHVGPGIAATPAALGQATSPSPASAAPAVMMLALADQVASSLPGGASSLSETYQDWQVACSQQDALKRCSLSQSQAQQNGQRVLAIELAAPDENSVNGIIVLPFGLALASGVVLQIDDNAAGQPLPFRTCLPVGCVVPVAFDADTISSLRAGVALKITTISDGGQQTPFAISLAGFAAGLDRVAALVE